jgi:hypothetical protein
VMGKLGSVMERVVCQCRCHRSKGSLAADNIPTSSSSTAGNALLHLKLIAFINLYSWL